MKRGIHWLIAIPAALMLLVGATGWVMLGTQPGLRWSLTLVSNYVPGTLHIERVEGRLTGPLTLHGVDYHHDGTEVTLHRVSLDWSPLSLVNGTLRVDVLHVDGGRLILAASSKSSSRSSPLFPMGLPFSVRLVDGRLRDVTVGRTGSEPVLIRQVTLKGTLRRDRLHLETLAVSLPNASAHLRGTVGLAPRMPITLDFDWHAEPARMAPASGKGTLRGNWSLLHVDQNLTRPVPVHLKMKIEQPLKTLRWQLVLSAAPFRLRQIDPRWGTGTLLVELHGQGTLTRVDLDGTLHTDAGARGLYPVTLSARLSRRPGSLIQITRLAVDLPEQKAALVVTGQLNEATRRFDLHAKWQNAAWPLHGTPMFASTNGRALLKGTPTHYRLGVDARLSGKDMPAGQWHVQGLGDENHFKIESLHAHLLSGKLDGSGTLGWKPKLTWDLNLAAQDMNPAVQWPAWPGRVTVHLETRGRMESDSLYGKVALSGLQGHLQRYAFAKARGLYPVTLSARLSRRPGSLIQITRLAVDLPEQKAALVVTGQLNEATRRFDLHAKWQNAAWPLHGTPMFASTNGRALLKGTPTHYRLGVDARLSGKDMPAGQWHVQGLGDENHFKIESLHAHLLSGKLDGSGTLGWKPKLTWDLNLAAQDMNPAVQWPAWPGRVTVHLETRGRMESDGPYGKVALSGLQGKLRGHVMKAVAEIRLAGKALDVRQLQLESGKARLRVRGKLARMVTLNWRLEAPQLGMLIPDWQGRLSGRGTVTGSRTALHLAAKIKGTRITGPFVQVAALNADLIAGFDPTRHGTVRVQAEGLEISGYRFATALLKADGNESSHQLSLTAHGPDALLEIRLHGRMENKSWTGTLNRARLSLPTIGDWTLLRPVSLHADNQRRSVSDACWRNRGARVCIDARQVPGQQWTAKLAVQDLPLADMIANVTSEVQVNGVAGFRLQASRTEGRPLEADMTLSLSPGSIRYRASNREEIPLEYAGGRVQAQLDSKGLHVTGDLQLGGTNHLDVDLDAPCFGSNAPELRRQAIRGSVHAHFDKLSLLADLTPDIGGPAGDIDVNLQLAGTLAKPQLRGKAALENGAFDILPMGIRVRQVSLTADADPGGRLRFRGQARSGKGAVKIDGSGDMVSVDHWHTELHLTGQDFEAANTADARIWVSPDLTLLVRPGRIDVKGQVKVPEARIHPTQMVSGTVRVSPDVVIVSGGKSTRAASTSQVSTRVRLILGEKVHFKGFGLTGQITGDLEVIGQPGTLTTGLGQLAIKKGTYRAYGQDLTIERGQFLFAGGPLDDPGVDVRAVRKIGSVTTAGGTITAGVQVAGTVKKPQLTLFSTPAMSQSETLSYLLTGHGLSSASASDGRLLMTAASTVGIKGGNVLAEKIGRLFGLQEAHIESGTTLQQSSLVLGKYLLPDLYVSYSVGFAEALNQLRIRYQFARHWALETESGLQTGADLLYTLER